MQLMWNRVKNCHPGHENIGTVNQNSHKRNGKHQASCAAAGKHGMKKANKREREEQACTKCHASPAKVMLNGISNGNGTKKTEKFKIGCHVLRRGSAITQT